MKISATGNCSKYWLFLMWLFSKQGTCTYVISSNTKFLKKYICCLNRAERIQSDLVYFLGDASKAYNNHFSNELRGMSDSPLGPTVIIFHETRYTKTLSEPNGKSPEMILEDHFNSLEHSRLYFSGIT